MQRLLDESDSGKLIIDLEQLFNENNVTMEQVDACEVPDDILSGILLDQNIITAQNTEQVSDLVTESDEQCAVSKPIHDKENANVKRFKAIEDNEVDSIANKSCKKRTHKQTTWGVKVFKG